MSTLMKRSRFVFAALVCAVLAGPLAQSASACAVCMGSSDAEIAPAINASIGMLLVFIAVMGAIFFKFLIFLARRDGLPLEPDGNSNGGMKSPFPQQS